MGNCLMSNKVMAQDEPDPQSSSSTSASTQTIKVDERADGSELARPKTEEARSAARTKKVVRFKLQEDENPGEGEVVGRSGGGGGSGGGVLRIKVVVSQKELKQILKDRETNSCTLEQMIAELKVKGRTVSDARADEDDDANGGWRPALESIPEDFH